MPLYKKITSKARVKTQNSFISPLLSTTQNNIKDLINDDYKETLPIPTKKKVLEPLINISMEGGLLDNLQRKSLKDLSNTLIEVSKTNETEKNRDGKKTVHNKPNHEPTNFRNDAKSTEDLTAQSPLLFPPSPVPSPIQRSSKKRFKTEKSITVTTKIGISSNTDLNDTLNGPAIKDIRMSQQLLKSDNLAVHGNGGMQHPASISDIQEDENDLAASLRTILDGIVSENEMLSQDIFEDGFEQNKEKSKNSKSEKIGKNKQHIKSNAKQSSENKFGENQTLKNCKKHIDTDEQNMQIEHSVIDEEENETDASTRSMLDNVVNENIILSQKIFGEGNSSKKAKKNKSNKRTKKNIDSVKSSFKSTSECGDEKSEVKSLKRIRALCSEEDDNVEQPPVINKNVNKGDPKKNKSGKTLKEKIKNKQSMIKDNFTKNKNEKGQAKTNMIKEQNNDKKNNEVKLKGKQLEKHRSLMRTADNGPRKPRNMIFTSETPKKNELNLKNLLQLQEERDIGLYVYCDSCDKVRYLEQCKDPLELPEKWFCYMNPDPNYNKCSDPNFDVEPEKEDLIIFNKYNAGSIVWAKMDGYPWWPALIDDDPDLTDYFWLNDENSQEPSWYHVTFFDTAEVTRAWIRTANLEPFEINAKNPVFKTKKYDYYRKRVNLALQEAKKACKMGILERLRVYSFVVRYFNKHGETQKGRRKEKIPKNLVDNTIKQNTYKDANLDRNSNLGARSRDSSENISKTLEPKKFGTNDLESFLGDDILGKNFDLNRFICNDNAFETLQA